MMEPDFDNNLRVQDLIHHFLHPPTSTQPNKSGFSTGIFARNQYAFSSCFTGCHACQKYEISRSAWSAAVYRRFPIERGKPFIGKPVFKKSRPHRPLRLCHHNSITPLGRFN
jgi:hypothetical protein